MFGSLITMWYMSLLFGSLPEDVMGYGLYRHLFVAVIAYVLKSFFKPSFPNYHFIRVVRMTEFFNDFKGVILELVYVRYGAITKENILFRFF